MALSDSQAAFKSLYLAYYPKLIRFVSLYIRDTIDTEEIVSDALLVVWNNRRALPDVKNPNAYIYSIARNKVVDYYRERRPDLVDLESCDIDLFLYTETTPEGDLIGKEEIERLNEAVNSLPGKCKMAFKLVREDKLRYKEAAGILNISVKTLEAHLSAAVRKLREVLSGE